MEKHGYEIAAFPQRFQRIVERLQAQGYETGRLVRHVAPPCRGRRQRRTLNPESTPMHKSRFCAFVIDCKTDDLDAATRFWSAVLGREPEPAAPDSPTYRGLKVSDGEPLMLLQKVDHESRVHLDVETDDVEAEAARLEALGARRVAKIRTWWVMEAPTGQRFCVVRPQRGPLGPDANVWP